LVRDASLRYGPHRRVGLGDDAHTIQAPVVLVVDDDEAVRAIAESDLEDAGYDALTADSVSAAVVIASRREIDVILLDIVLPRGGGEPTQPRAGIDAIPELRAVCPSAEIVMLSAHDCAQLGMEAVRRGASDFVVKPYHPPEQLVAAVARAIERGRTRREVTYLREELATLKGTFVAGPSPAMRRLMEQLDAVAATDAAVLLTGETGTGKELVARAIHARGPRKDGPFVAINVAALPGGLVESTLFGHERGAFTGAVQSRPGRFETARGGTLLLDEIGELDSELQVKLLRVLQEAEFERVGGTKTIPCDVRVIAATNRDLQEDARQRRFRQDLYFRLAVVPLSLPPLRDRIEDLRELFSVFLDRYSRKHGRPRPVVDDKVFDHLRRYDWPGNVRELEHLVQRLIVLKAPGAAITEEDLPVEYRGLSLVGADVGSAAEGSVELRSWLEASERDLILRTLARCGGNRHKAAALLGIHPATMFRKLNRLGIQGE
jgi:two-component system response regulator AtoC